MLSRSHKHGLRWRLLWAAGTLVCTSACWSQEAGRATPQAATQPTAMPQRWEIDRVDSRGSTPKSTTQSASTRPAARTYTAPGGGVRAMSLIGPAASLALGAYSPSSRTGRERSEASVTSPLGVVSGRPGLATSTTIVASAIQTKGGLGQVARAGLGFVSPNNLLNSRTNPFSGPGGVSQTLSAAGFFRPGGLNIANFRR